MELSFQTRLTMTAVREGEEWKIVSLHMSAPADQQEGEEFSPSNTDVRPWES